MSSLEQTEQPVGNTKQPAKVPKKARLWAFTLNNPHEVSMTPELLEQKFHSLGAVGFVFQLEEGASKTPHYQGCLKVKNPIAMPKHVCPQIHWETARNWDKLTSYCQKAEGRLAGPWAFGVDIVPPLKIITDLRPWQEQVVEVLDEEPDDRSIHWYWESTGNAGKTAMAKFICTKYPKSIFLSGKSSDCKYAVQQYLDKNKVLHAAIFGFTRSQEQFISYQALEEVKDGIFFSSKYESGMCMYNSPHVIVFANFPPDMEKLSKDRWYVECIDEMDK